MGDARPASGKVGALDGYRGLAAAMIVVYHTYNYSMHWYAIHQREYSSPAHPIALLFQNLDVGVSLFFVLSGALLFRPFARALLDAGPLPSVRAFFRRRALRIAPAYYVALLILWPFTALGRPDGWRDLVEHLTFTHIFELSHMADIIGVEWSLADEAIYYVFIGLFCLAIARRCRRLATPDRRFRLLAGLLVAGIAISVSYRYWCVATDPTNVWGTFNPLSCFDAFALGMLVALVAARSPGLPPGRVPVIALRAAGFALIAVAMALRPLTWAMYFYVHSLTSAGFALVLLVSFAGPATAPWERFFASKPLAWLGAISYSLYLWHLPVLRAASHGPIVLTPSAFGRNVAIEFALALTVATVSYVLIERPALRLRYRPAIAGRPAPARGGAAPAPGD